MKKNNKKGFTLVELVIVVAVMAVLVAVAIPTIASITGEAKAAVNESNAKTIESIVKLAEADVSDTATGLTPEVAAKAIYDAKLGLKTEDGQTPTFYYTPSTGAVSVASEGATLTGEEWKIEFVNYTGKDTNAAVDGVQVTPSKEKSSGGYETDTANVKQYPEKKAG